MDNGFSTNDAVLTAAMSGGLSGNRSGSWGGNGYGVGNEVLASHAHADGTGIGNSVKSLSELTRFGFDSNQEQIRESRNIDQFNGIKDNQFRAELRGSDQVSALARDVANNAREMDRTCCTLQQDIANSAKDAAKCCCDAQLLAVQNQAMTMAAIKDNAATMLAVEGRAVERSLNAANAELTSLKTQIACGCCTPSAS